MAKVPARSNGGKATAAKRTPEERKAAALKASKAKSELAKMPKISHEGTIHIGDIEIPCYITESGDRVLSGRALQIALHLTDDAPGAPGDRVDRLLSNGTISPLILRGKPVDQFEPVKCRYDGNPRPINGYRAEVLADICEGMLEARQRGLLTTARNEMVAKQCEVLLRGFARVGIIALVDEATGFQKDRERDALARILEAFVAKELQPYIKTFPADYYEELFRLRGLPFPPAKPQFRPQYFGLLTNDIVYERIAPGLLSELKKQAAKDEKKAHLHRRLTQEVGHPKLREHLASVVTAMKLSSNYPDFIGKLNRIHPRLGDTIPLDLEEPDR